MTAVKPKPYSPEYELARELIAGEFSSVFHDQPDKAWTRGEIEDLAIIINDLRAQELDVIQIVEANKVQDYLTNLTAKHGAKFEKGGAVDLGFGCLGNGTTVWDRSREENRDYKNVAHISEEGEISYYDKNLPANAIAEIEKMAERQKAIKEIWGGSSGYINYGQHYIDAAKRVTDKFNEILASESDNKKFTPITPQNIHSIKFIQPTQASYDIEYGDGDFAIINDTNKLDKNEVKAFIDQLPNIQKSLEKGIGGYNHYAKGGRVRNISRDRKFISQEYWEQAYKKHRTTKGKRYHRYGEGGVVSAAELIGQTFFIGDTTRSGQFMDVHSFYDFHRLADALTVLNQNKIPFVAEYQFGSNVSDSFWNLMVLEEDCEKVVQLLSLNSEAEEFEAAQEHGGEYAQGGNLPFSDRYSATVGEEVEGRGFPVFAQITGYAPTTVGYYKTKEAAQTKADKLLADNTNSITIEGVEHKQTAADQLHHNKQYVQIEGSGHPLGVVYIKKHNPKYGYVPSGYSWYKFDLKEWNIKNPTMQIGTEKLEKGGGVRNLHRDRMFISEQDWEQAYLPHRVKRGKRYHHHYAQGGEVGSALAWLKELDLAKLPKVVSKQLKTIIDNPESENIELSDSDFIELKSLIENKFASAIPSAKTENKEVEKTEKETPVSVLKTRIKIITAKIKAEPKNPVWKTRLKIVNKMIEQRK